MRIVRQRFQRQRGRNTKGQQAAAAGVKVERVSTSCKTEVSVCAPFPSFSRSGARAPNINTHTSIGPQQPPRIALMPYVDGFSTPKHKLLGRDGREIKGLCYSWIASLDSQGLRLATRFLLGRLSQFRSTQLASYGFTGLPLLTSWILLGDGRFSGLAIRGHGKDVSHLLKSHREEI